MVISKSKPESVVKACNCWVVENCPLQGDCQQGSVIYQAEVKTDTSSMKYIGSTGGIFKARYNNHKYSLNNRNTSSTTLSSHVWALKDAGKEFNINWKIIAKTSVYAPGARFCDLCLIEKT